MLNYNRLANQSSPFLKRASNQPVNWFPWGREAFSSSRDQDKPMLLIIGASWNHWNHILDHVFFTNTDTTKTINDYYVSVRVDRDERPDLYSHFRKIVNRIAGKSSLPLLIWLTPEGHIFHYKTFTAESPETEQFSLARTIENLGIEYARNRQEINAIVQGINYKLSADTEKKSDMESMDLAISDITLDNIYRHYDSGTGTSKTFPSPDTKEFILENYFETGEYSSLEFFDTALKNLAHSPMHDHIGGGFHGCSVDQMRVGTCFEKLAAYNAGLLMNYLHAFQLTGEELFSEVSTGIIDYILETLYDRNNGGFYAGQEGCSESEKNGAYYTWTEKEASSVLDEQTWKVIRRLYGIRKHNWSSPGPTRNVLRVAKTKYEIAAELNISLDEVDLYVFEGNEELVENRRDRQEPFVDKSIYANINGRIIRAMLEAHSVHGRWLCLDAALKTLDRFLDEGMNPEGGFYHSLTGEGSSAISLLDDQVQMILALISAFNVTGDDRYIHHAVRAMEFAIDNFWNEKKKCFLEGPPEDLMIPHYPYRGIEDTETSSPNVAAVFCLISLHAASGDEIFLNNAEKLIDSSTEKALLSGAMAATYARALRLYMQKPAVITIIGSHDNIDTSLLIEAAEKTYRPFKIVLRIDTAGDMDENEMNHQMEWFMETYGPEAPVAFISTGMICTRPITDPDELARMINSFNVRKTA